MRSLFVIVDAQPCTVAPASSTAEDHRGGLATRGILLAQPIAEWKSVRQHSITT
jgi:hypothetical protein